LFTPVNNLHHNCLLSQGKINIPPQTGRAKVDQRGDIVEPAGPEGALARDLFVAIKRLSKDLGLSFSMNLVQQFAQRFSNDLDTIRQAGFEIAVNRPKCVGHRTAAYHIT